MWSVEGGVKGETPLKHLRNVIQLEASTAEDQQSEQDLISKAGITYSNTTVPAAGVPDSTRRGLSHPQ